MIKKHCGCKIITTHIHPKRENSLHVYVQTVRLRRCDTPTDDAVDYYNGHGDNDDDDAIFESLNLIVTKK